MPRTKDEIAADFKAGKIDAETMIAELAAASRKPMEISIGDKGWLKLKFDGFRFPTSLSLPQCEQMFSPEGVKAINDFIAANRNRFAVK